MTVDALFRVGLINALVATLLAIGVFLISKRWRNPLVIHALCLVVLLKFVAPPLLGILIPHKVNDAPATSTGESDVLSEFTYEAPTESHYVDVAPIEVESPVS